MAKTSLPILPFPDHIDRDYFAAYLSGLTDGEGHFALGLREYRNHLRPVPRVYFDIALRADDLGILRLIQSFFGFGYIQHIKEKTQYGFHRRDQFRYRVDCIPDLVRA